MNGHPAFEHALDELGTANILDGQKGGPIPPAQVDPPSRPLHTRVFSVWLSVSGAEAATTREPDDVVLRGR